MKRLIEVKEVYRIEIDVTEDMSSYEIEEKAQDQWQLFLDLRNEAQYFHDTEYDIDAI